MKKIVQELEKDVNRLRLVSDRFGKIGSTPQLEEVDVVRQISRNQFSGQVARLCL